MNNANQEKQEDGGWWKKGFSPSDFFRTYLWAMKTKMGFVTPPPFPITMPWWKFLFASSVILVLSIATGIVGTVRLNVFSLGVSVANQNTLELITTIGDHASLIKEEMLGNGMGSELFVLSSSAIFCFMIMSALSAFLAIPHQKSIFFRTFRERFSYICYMIAALTVTAAIGWVAISGIGVSLRALVHPFWPHTLNWKIEPWILVGADLIVSVGIVFIAKFQLDNTSRNSTIGRRATTIVLPLIAMPVVVMTMGQLGYQWFSPSLELAISRKCGAEECYAYFRLEHAPSIIIDTPITFQVKLNILKKPPLGPDVIYGQAEIDLVPLDDKGPVVLDPNASRRILKVQNIKLNCALKTDEYIALIPEEMSGYAPVFLPEHASNNPNRRIDVSATGPLLQMLRHAKGNCPVGMR